MLHDDRIDAFEEIDINKTSASNKCDICHYWYFLDKGFNFQPNVCNGCHGVLMMSAKLTNIAMLIINNSDYCCSISKISKSDAVDLLQNADLTNGGGVL